MDHTNTLNNLNNADGQGTEPYCLSCCSNSRPTAAVSEVWDLTCNAGTSHFFTKVSEQYFCQEFRFLRNKFKGDETVLYCRLERAGEQWFPSSSSPDYSKWEASKEECIAPTLPRDAKSAFRGYTMELTVEERTDGVDYRTQVHDCEITVDEQLNVPMRDKDVWNPGSGNLIYEKIILKSPETLIGYSVPLHFVIALLLVFSCCFVQGVKRKRDEPCRVCMKRLILSKEVCYWCKFFKAVPMNKDVYKDLEVNDKVKRDDIKDTNDRSFYQAFEHFLQRGLAQVVMGTTSEEDKYEEEAFDMELGYRDSYPSGKPIVPSSLFEKDTGIKVVQTQLFDEFGNRDFYPSFAPGAPAREVYNRKKIFQLGYYLKKRDAKVASKGALVSGDGPETDELPPATLEREEGEDMRKKRKKKKKKRKKKNKLPGEEEDKKNAMVGFALGVDDGGDSKRKFKPSAVAKPARSALRSKMAKSIPSEGSGVSFAAATTSNQDSHEEDDDDLEIQFDMLADQAAGAAAARFGHVESLPEESKEKSGKKQEGSNVAHRRQNLLSIDFTKESLMRKVKEDRERELEVRYEASVHSDPCPSVTLLTFGAARMQVSRHPRKV